MRLIDADALIRELKGIKVTFGSGNGLVEGGIEIAISTTNAQPTVDAVERKRGEWVKNDGRRGWHCSECKVDNFYAYVWNSETEKNDFQDRYCPNCGAEMRKGEEECLETK